MHWREQSHRSRVPKPRNVRERGSSPWQLVERTCFEHGRTVQRRDARAQHATIIDKHAPRAFRKPAALTKHRTGADEQIGRARFLACKQLGNMGVTVYEHLRYGIARRDASAARETDAHISWVVRHETGRAKRWTEEPYSSKSLLPSTAIVGASSESSRRMEGPPISPAWMM